MSLSLAQVLRAERNSQPTQGRSPPSCETQPRGSTSTLGTEKVTGWEHLVSQLYPDGLLGITVVAGI